MKRPKKGIRGLGSAQQQALDLLESLASDTPQNAEEVWVPMLQWRTALGGAGLLGGDTANRRQRFSQLHNSLEKRGRVVIRDDSVRVA